MIGNVVIDFGQPQTVNAIDLDYEARYAHRLRLGLSQAGHKCGRFLWFTHHKVPSIAPSGRVLRLFQLGNLLEDQTIADLKRAGVRHHSGQEQVSFNRGNITLVGHIDGIVENLIEASETPHLFEHKTCSLKKFKQLLKKGYRAWNEVYYWQTQFYMLGLGLKRAAAFVYCKDNSELYMERIALDKQATVDRLNWVFDVISEAIPPRRSCPNASWFEAKFCPFSKICWKKN